MASAFGFDEAAQDMEVLTTNAETVNTVYDKSATKIVNRSKSIASGKGLQVTGAGVAGIVKEVDGNGFKAGWGGRPGLHLYFHEIGTYKDPPRPHLRPTVDELEPEIQEDIQNHLTK